jgi:hypothetical protein
MWFELLQWRAPFMRGAVGLSLALAIVAVASATAHAQDQPPPIGPFVIDLRGSFSRFPADQGLADSRGLGVNELPGPGFGVDAGAHVYPLRWGVVTFGFGAQVTAVRARSSGSDAGGVAVERPVTGRFLSLAPQLSFNFGSGNGWSYISGGVGPAAVSLVPDGQGSSSSDDERLTTLNYGAGARWFTRPHLAFTLDVRFYAMPAGTPRAGFQGSPPVTVFVAGAGISLK